MVKFILTEEHIKLISELNFKTMISTEYDDAFIPGIDRKRPFGNSGATYSVCEILGFERDSDGDFPKSAFERAETLLIELPVAMEIVVQKHTFESGEYEVNEYSAYFQYKSIRSYHYLKEPFEKIKNTLCDTEDDKRQYEQMVCTAINCMDENPYKIIADIKWFKQTDFLTKAVEVLEKWAVENWISKHDGEDYCRYCSINDECPHGVVYYGDAPVEPPCVIHDLMDFLDTENILEDLENGEEQ